MRRLDVLYHMMLSDFLERVRSYNFLITILVTVFVTYFFIPGLNASVYATLNLGGYRPIYNSAWIGSMVTLLMVEFLPYFGFFLVKGTIERDQKTGVGQILATTPLTKITYCVGKWLSNLAVFVALTLSMIVASIFLQFVRGEEFRIDLWNMASPFFLVLLPMLAVIAAIAVLFETINWLRGGFGNIFYFVVLFGLMGLTDIQGTQTLWPSIYQSCKTYFSECNAFRQIDISGNPLTALPIFTYEGVVWDPVMVASRLIWFLVAIGITLAASLFFHRFDPAKMGLRTEQRQSLFSRLLAKVKSMVSSRKDDMDHSDLPSQVPVVHLTRLPKNAYSDSQLFNLILAEIRLTFWGINWWWYLVAAALIVFSFSSDSETALMIYLPLVWVWPVLIWSGMGVRETRYGTGQYVFSAPHPVRRQFFSTWVVGFVIALSMASGIFLRLAIAGEWASIPALLIGAMFIPSVALAMGCWSGSSKLFEAVYLFVWYMAVVQGVIYLDFMGRLSKLVGWQLPGVYVILTAVALGFAVSGRIHQLKK